MRHWSWTLLIILLAVLSGMAWAKHALPARKYVRVLYLVPRDREFQPEFQLAIEECVLHLQKWYASKMEGKTFRLDEPIVSVHKTDRDADWYNTRIPPNRPPSKNYTTYNTLEEVCSILGYEFQTDSYIVTHSDSNSVWLIYNDAPGGSGAGDDGFAVLPDHDLRGLVGLAKDQSPIRRWIGGSGHEIGHGFGLIHPQDDAPTAIMKKAYSVYPDCELTDNDIFKLSRSPFFSTPEDLKVVWNATSIRWLVSCLFLSVIGAARVYRGFKKRKNPDNSGSEIQTTQSE